jgi:hypothetical protein
MKQVVNTCETMEQLTIADWYCRLLILMYARHNNIYGDVYGFEVHFTKLELFDYLTDLVSNKTLDLQKAIGLQKIREI